MALNQPAFWVNADGLFIPFGRSIGAERYVGEFCDGGQVREVQVVLPLADLADNAETILSETIRFPVGARFEEVEVYVRNQAVGGTDLDLGFVALDRTTHNTSADQDGLLANVASTLIDVAAAGATFKFRGDESVPAGATGAGVMLTTPVVLTEPVLLTATTNGDFTAGLLYIRIRYAIDPTAGQIGN